MFVAIVFAAFALSLRACWISLENDAFTLAATIAISVLSAVYAGWLRARLVTLLSVSLASAVVLSSVFSLERVFHSPDVMFTRDRIETFYFDDPTMNFIAVVVHSTIATVIGTLAGYLVCRFRDWLTLNLLSLGIIFAVSMACGYTGYKLGGYAFPHVPSSQLSFFSCVLGAMLGTAWVVTYRSFPMSALGNLDAG